MSQDKEYVVRGAMLECSCGSQARKLNLPQDHGVYTKNGLPMIHEEDCVVDRNIASFGICQRPGGEGDMITLEVPPEENHSNGPTYQPSISKAPKVLTGPACVPELLNTTWQEAYERVVIDDGGHKKTVTTESYLICRCGHGIITVVTSGQEQNGVSILSAMMKESDKEKQMMDQDLVIMMSKKTGNRSHSYLPRDPNELQKMYDDPSISKKERDKIKEQQKSVDGRNQQKNRNNAHKKPKKTLKQKRKEKQKKQGEGSQQDTKITPGTQIIVDEKALKTTAKVTGAVVGTYVLYLGVKWVVAGLLAPPTGGTSLVLAAVTP